MFEHVLRHSMVLWFEFIDRTVIALRFLTQAQVTLRHRYHPNPYWEEINLTIEECRWPTRPHWYFFPEGKTFGSLEVIDSYKIDTALADSKYRLIKRYGLTQFDSGPLHTSRIAGDDRRPSLQYRSR